MPVWWKAMVAGIFLTLSTATAAAGTLDEVRARGHLECGLTGGMPGLSDRAGDEWRGLHTDICRAIAATIFGDPGKVKFREVDQGRPFDLLRFGVLDVLMLHSGRTMQRDMVHDIRFAATTFHDGQSFMVRKALGIASALELSGATICLHKGTLEEQNIKAFFESKKMPFEAVVIGEKEKSHEAYLANRCSAYSGAASKLHAARLGLPAPEEHVILPEVISKEAAGIYVRGGDRQWFDLARWTMFALVNAEELGITSANADDLKSSEKPSVRRLLGQDGNYGGGLGLDAEWAYRVVSKVGNYGEIFERNIGAGGVLKMERGINALWNKGGILYAPPIR